MYDLTMKEEREELRQMIDSAVPERIRSSCTDHLLSTLTILDKQDAEIAALKAERCATLAARNERDQLREAFGDIDLDKLRPGIVTECREAMHGMLDDYLDMSPLSTRQRAAVEKMIVLLRELGEP